MCALDVCMYACVRVCDGLVVLICSGVGFGLQLDGGIMRREELVVGIGGEGGLNYESYKI